MMRYIFLSLLMLPGCQIPVSSDTTHDQAVIDLRVSTKIIRELIKFGRLAQAFEDVSSHEPIEQLLDNYSPATLAFESDVLQSSQPVVLYYKVENDSLIVQLEKLARSYQGDLRFVVVDANYFYQLADQAEIDNFPAIVVIADRKEQSRFEGTVEVEKQMNFLIENIRTVSV